MTSSVTLAIHEEKDVEHLRRWRERQAWRTGRASIVARVLSYAIRLAVIPLSLRLLGADRYGLWLTVGSLIAWMGVTDLGISPGLINALARASGEDDRPLMQSHVSTALLAYTLLALPAAALTLVIAHWQGLGRLLGIPPGATLEADARALVLICGGMFAVSLLINVVKTVCSALQEGYLGAYASVAGAAAGLALLVALPLASGSVVEYGLVMVVPPLLASVVLGIFVFGWRYPYLRPRFRSASLRSLRILAGFGGPLLLVQLANLGMLYSSNLLISNRLGPGVVPQFAVPRSIFFIFTGGCYLIISPYIAACAEASGRGDWVWLRKRAFLNLRNAIGLMLVASIGLIAFGRPAIRIYTHSIVIPSPAFLFAMAGFCLITVWRMTNGVLLIGLGRVRTKAAIELSIAIIFVAATWLLLPSMGIIAVPIAGILAHLVDLPWSLPSALRYIRRQETQTSASVAVVEAYS